MPPRLDDARLRETPAGWRFVLELIKYIVATCIVSICASMFMSPLGSQRTYYNTANAVPGSQAGRNEFSVFDSSLLDSRRYVKGPAMGKFRGACTNISFEYAAHETRALQII